MIAVERGRTCGGDVVYTGYVQVDEHEGIPVLEPAGGKGGRSRESVVEAIDDARVSSKALKKLPSFRRLRATIAVQRSKPSGRTVYSGLVKVDEHEGVPVIERAAGSGFHWPENIDEAIAAARKKESA